MFELPHASYADWRDPANPDSNRPRTDLDQHTVTINVPIIVSFSMNAKEAEERSGLSLLQAAHAYVRNVRRTATPTTNNGVTIMQHAPVPVYIDAETGDMLDEDVRANDDAFFQLPAIHFEYETDVISNDTLVESLVRNEHLRQRQNKVEQDFRSITEMMTIAEDEYDILNSIGQAEYGYVFQDIKSPDIKFVGQSVRGFMAEHGITSDKALFYNWNVVQFETEPTFQMMYIRRLPKAE